MGRVAGSKPCELLKPGDQVPSVRTVAKVVLDDTVVTVTYTDGSSEPYAWGSALPEVIDGPRETVEAAR